MHPPRKRRSPPALAENGHADRWAYSWIKVVDKLIQYAVLCGQRIWTMSNSKTHREQMMEDLMEEAERWDLEPKPASLCVDQHLCCR